MRATLNQRLKQVFDTDLLQSALLFRMHPMTTDAFANKKAAYGSVYRMLPFDFNMTRPETL